MLNIRLFAIKKDVRRENNRLESAQIVDDSRLAITQIKQSVRWLERQARKLEQRTHEHFDQHETLRQGRKLLLSKKRFEHKRHKFRLCSKMKEGI